MKRLNILFLLAALVTAACAYNATPEPDMATRSFLSRATQMNVVDIRLSEMALARSQDGQIAVFAQDTLADHTKLAADLRSTVAAAGLDPAWLPGNMERNRWRLQEHNPESTARPWLNENLDAGYKSTLKNIKYARAEDFDAHFIVAQRTLHDQEVALFEEYARSGGNVPLRNFALRMLPRLKEHQMRANALRAQTFAN